MTPGAATCGAGRRASLGASDSPSDHALRQASMSCANSPSHVSHGCGQRARRRAAAARGHRAPHASLVRWLPAVQRVAPLQESGSWGRWKPAEGMWRRGEEGGGERTLRATASAATLAACAGSFALLPLATMCDWALALIICTTRGGHARRREH